MCIRGLRDLLPVASTTFFNIGHCCISSGWFKMKPVNDNYDIRVVNRI